MTASPIETWRLLPFASLPADRQLACSEAMLAGGSAPALRWYQISPEALILGHGQSAESVDWHACHAEGHRVYRRSTGGGAVLGGIDMLSLDVVLPAGHRLAVRDVARSYEWLGSALADGLRSAGVAAETVSPQQARAQVASLAADDPTRLACYALFSPYEIQVAGRKLVGLAQARRHASALLQAGILLRWRPQRLVSLLQLSSEERTSAAAILSRRAAGLGDLNRAVELSELMQILTRAIASAATAEIRAAAWTASERAAFAEAPARFLSLDGPSLP